MRFCLNKLIVDNDNVTLLTPGPNYNFSIKQIESGYTVEAKIPWTVFHDMVPADNVFKPVEGMRIPIDFEINDNDSIGHPSARQGIMAYSTLNQDNSYSDVWRWTYTWIGNKMSPNAVNNAKVVPNVYALMQNYPNPFNPSTQIHYSLAKDGYTTLKVYDILGREVATLVNAQEKAGEHTVPFNSASIRSGLASGVYFYRIESGSFVSTKKMMLLK